MISQSRYVRIVSGVGAGAAVAQRQLILRLITQNAQLPPGIVAEFTTSDSVGSFFGTNSEEYKRALAYFGFISKQIKAPGRLSFARWVSAPIAPLIVGDAQTKTLNAIKAFSTGTLTLNTPSVVPLTGLNFSSATSLTQVASILQTVIQANTDPMLHTTATVTYNTNTNQFVINGATIGAGGVLSATATGLSTDVSQVLGIATTGTVNVPGQAADTPDVAVSKSAAISNNFGSFAFTTPSTPLTNDQIVAIALWNDAQNNMFMFCVATTLANGAALSALVIGYAGVALSILATSAPNDFIEQSPAEIVAATDYTSVNATQNFMYYQFPSRNITVSDDTTANTADALRLNYIGVTQNAGQQLAFYQRGILCGGSQDPTDMNTYANEMWLKSAIASQIMSLFLAMGRVPANIIGQAMILAVMQATIDTAKNNGTISAGKTLTTIQQQYITQVSGDDTAWRQIANIGYWLNITFSSYVNSNTNLTEWKATYTLLYSKDDAIRLVEGSDILI